MRILFAIPHYFGPGSSSYGSSDLAGRGRRIASLRQCIMSLHQHFGPGQRQLLGSQRSCSANEALSAELNLTVCVHGDNHLLDELDLPEGSFRRYQSEVGNPLLLGYSCYELFRQEYGNYDWYCFLEDDIIISDPLFFLKLNEFYRIAGSARYILHPNRYELSVWPHYSKVYIDGPLPEDITGFIRDFRLPGLRDEILLPFGGVDIRLVPADNTHSGCFFLTPVHLAHLLEQPWYGKPVTGYADHLTAVANMYLITLFNVYKPALECASFLEVHHHYQKYVGGQ